MNELPDSPSVDVAVEQLTAVANAPSGEAALELMEAFVEEAESSDEKFDVAFLAVQLVRDMGQLDDDEAALVFHLLGAPRGCSYDTNASAAVEFLRERGESVIADRIETDRDKYAKWVGEGQQSLLGHRPHEEDRSAVESPALIARISECAAALVATVAGTERAVAWKALRESIQGLAAEGRVGAIRALRELGMLTSGEYAALIDVVMQERYWTQMTADREWRREDNASLRASAARSEAARKPSSESQPERPSRRDRIRAKCLRQVGEHDLANLLLADPAGYRDQMDRRFAELPFEWDVERGNRDALREKDRDTLRRNEDGDETIIRYAMGRMARTELIDFEERLMTDKEFFEKLAPSLSIWMTSRPVPSEIRRRLDAWRRKDRRQRRWRERLQSMKWMLRHWLGGWARPT